jgi:hypothetical protein
VEKQIKRFEKYLDEAGTALQQLRKDSGRGAQTTYKDLAGSLRTVRRNAQKTNRSLLKDLDKLRTAVTPGASTSRSSSRSSGRSGGTRSKSGSSRSSSSRSSGRSRSGGRSGGSRSGSSRSGGSSSGSRSS